MYAGTTGRVLADWLVSYHIVAAHGYSPQDPKFDNNNNSQTNRADELAAAIVRDLETLHLAGGAAGGAGGMSASVLFDFGDAARQLRMLILLGKVCKGGRWVCMYILVV